MKIFDHFKKVCIHKYWVGKYCFKLGLYWQGITHDLSKFSWEEFSESVKYYNGKISPIDVCKSKNGYSNAWLHHKGRNKHHAEYWYDMNLPQEDKTIPMPKKYAMELICDYIGAARAYLGKDFSFENERKWWNEKKKVVTMNRQTMVFVSMCMATMTMYDRFITKIEIDSNWELSIEISNI